MKFNPYQSALGGGNTQQSPFAYAVNSQSPQAPPGPMSPAGVFRSAYGNPNIDQFNQQRSMAQYGSALGGGGNQMMPASPFGSITPQSRGSFSGQPFYGGGGFGTQMGQASPGGFNFSRFSPFSGGLGQSLGRFGAMALGSSFGGPVGGFAAGQLFNRFSGGQQPSRPSPFMPQRMGGSGQSGLDDNSRVPFSPMPGNIGPNGNQMTGMGGYRSRAGNVQGQINSSSMGGFNDQQALQNQLQNQEQIAQIRARMQMS